MIGIQIDFSGCTSGDDRDTNEWGIQSGSVWTLSPFAVDTWGGLGFIDPVYHYGHFEDDPVCGPDDASYHYALYTHGVLS